MQVGGLARQTSWSVALPRAPGWLAVVLAAALLIGELPLLLSACCAPPQARGLGTAWFVNDFAQYESAMRQGAEQPGWLVYDAFTAEPHQPTLMFPLYVGLGKLGALLHVPPDGLERLTEVIVRALLVLAVWRFCHAFAVSQSAARAAVLLTLFGSGFEALAGLFGLPYTGNWSYETNTFGLLFGAPHVPLAMAATLELARRWLRPQRDFSPWAVLWSAALGAAIALLHPFHLAVLLAALLLVGSVFWRTGQGLGSLAGALAATLGGLPVLWVTLQTFTFDPFWAATYGAQNILPSPAPHELVVDLGATLLLAVGGAVMLRGRVAPFGILVWLLLGLIAMYLPVPYQRRLGFGIQPALAILAANGLLAACTVLERWQSTESVYRQSFSGKRFPLLTLGWRWRLLPLAAGLRLAVVALAASGTVLVVVGVASSALRDWPLPIYRSTTDLDTAVAWLAERTQPDEVVLADWSVSNYLAPRLRGRVFGGHPVATLNASEKQFAIAALFAHTAGLDVARQFGVHWLVYGPAEAGLVGPGVADFQSGEVRIYRVRARP